MSHFSSWNCQTFTTRRSPSRIHMRFFSFPGLPPGHSDADNLLLFSHSRDQGEGGLKRFRLRHSRRPKPSDSIVGSSSRPSPTGTYGNGRGGASKNVGLTMSTPSGSSYFWSSTWPNQYTT